MTSSNGNVRSRKPIFVFLVHALLLAVLIGYWPTPREVYPEFFRSQARFVYGAGEEPSVYLAAATRGEDTVMEGYTPGSEEPAWRVSISAITLGYWPSAVMLALLLATPLSTRSRCIAAALGLLWLHAFALGRLGLAIWLGFEEVARGIETEASGAVLGLRTGLEVLNSNIVVIASVFLAWVVLARPLETLSMGRLGEALAPGAGGSPRGEP